MVVKELDPSNPTDVEHRAGRSAEEQLAFYLRRAFGKDKEIRVFNGLRYEVNGDAAQIDHLVLHRFGMVIVESKSVAVRVAVTEQGEWTRWVGSTPKGMPSPILQAQRQAAFLKDLLKPHAEELLRRTLGVQCTFAHMPTDVLVAISDSGVIKRPRHLRLDELCKADQVPDRVTALRDQYRRANGLLSFDYQRMWSKLTDEEFDRMVSFLLQHHRPLQPRERVAAPDPIPPKYPVTSPKPAPPAELARAPVPASPSQTLQAPKPAPPLLACRHCGSASVRIEHGPYGYYLRCIPCGGNTAIYSLCASCGSKERVHKSGAHFSIECERCGTRRHFYTNPEGS